MKKEMLINVLQPEECRIAIVEDGILEELYVERTSQESYVGNIYKGRIVNIEPSIQAAFVDFGIGRNGFLHVSDVDPAYYRHLEGRESGGRRGDRGGDRDRDRRRERERPRREPAPEVGYEPPAALAAPPPPREEEHAFGAGLFDEDLPSPAPDAATAEAAAAEAAATGGRPIEAAAEAVADEESGPGTPAAEAEEEVPARKRRRVRRRRRGEAKEAEESPAEEPGTSASGGTGGGAAPEEESRSELECEPGSPPPRLGSAERRTEDDDLSFAGSVEPRGGSEGPHDRADNGSDEGLWSATADDAGESADEELAGDDEDEPGRSAEVEDDDLHEEEDDELFEAGEGRGGGGPRRRDRRGPPRGRRRLGRDGNGRPKPLIQDIFKRGQEVIVQVIKEGIGTKGPTLSTYISIAGRYLVLMPGLNRIGVSRKIADDDQRHRLKDILTELNPPKGVGFIIRTAGVDRNKKELQNDLAYLLRIWQVVARRVRKQKAPSPVYQESDMITRTIRDTFTSDIDTIWVDESGAFEHAQEFLQGVMPRYASRLKLYQSSEPLFYKYKIEEEIARIQQRKVPLPHGGSIVIEQTEALVAIDVNSGSFRADNNAEETAYQMNLHAAREIARQLRLRDLGGVIINDFIDMREEKHRRAVEKALRDAVKRDRARTKVLKISQFGIIEMTRQRIRPSLKRSVYQDCPHCLGTGHVKSVESMSIDVMRMLQLAAHKEPVCRVQVRVCAPVAEYLLNRKRREIGQLEDTGNIQVTVTGLPGVPPETLDVVCYDKHNNEVKLLPPEPPTRHWRGHSGR